MFKHLLVPIDDSELSERLTQSSLALAAQLGARITAFVSEPVPPLPSESTNPVAYARNSDEHRARTEQHAQSILTKFAALAAAQNVPFEGKFKRSTSVDSAIVEAAVEYACDLVVMVTHGRGAFGEMLFGSHTKAVLARSKVPLLVLH